MLRTRNAFYFISRYVKLRCVMFALNYEQATQMVTLLSTVRYTQSVQRHIFHPKSESGHLLIGHNSVVAAAGGNT